MPKYQIYFDTVEGEIRYNVDIDEDETMETVLEDVLHELEERGHRLKGEGEPQVIWSGQQIDALRPLPEQGVRPNDLLRVSTVLING